MPSGFFRWTLVTFDGAVPGTTVIRVRIRSQFPGHVLSVDVVVAVLDADARTGWRRYPTWNDPAMASINLSCSVRINGASGETRTPFHCLEGRHLAYRSQTHGALTVIRTPIHCLQNSCSSIELKGHVPGWVAPRNDSGCRSLAAPLQRTQPFVEESDRKRNETSDQRMV